MRKKVEEVLEEVRQALRLHAGGIELVRIDEKAGRVEVKLTGTCDGCALAKVTLKQGVEAALARKIPEIREVVAVNL